MIELTVMGKPVGKERPRFARTQHGIRTYTPKRTETYQKSIFGAYMDKYKGTTLKGGIWAQISAYFDIPKSTPKYKRDSMRWYDKKPDADNIAKTVLDALNGVAYEDDKQIVMLQVRKEYGEPRVEIRLGEMEVDGCDM